MKRKASTSRLSPRIVADLLALLVIIYAIPVGALYLIDHVTSQNVAFYLGKFGNLVAPDISPDHPAS